MAPTRSTSSADKHQVERADTLNAMRSAVDSLYAAWSERIEADDIHTPDTAQAFEGEDAQRATRALLEDIVGAKELDRAIGRGRPTLAGAGKRGESPKVQVRLPRELDAALKARAAIEHRKPSEVAREAIALYLRNAS